MGSEGRISVPSKHNIMAKGWTWEIDYCVLGTPEAKKAKVKTGEGRKGQEGLFMSR